MLEWGPVEWGVAGLDPEAVGLGMAVGLDLEAVELGLAVGLVEVVLGLGMVLELANHRCSL